jgi:hypothetical protein
MGDVAEAFRAAGNLSLAKRFLTKELSRVLFVGLNIHYQSLGSAIRR